MCESVRFSLLLSLPRSLSLSHSLFHSFLRLFGLYKVVVAKADSVAKKQGNQIGWMFYSNFAKFICSMHITTVHIKNSTFGFEHCIAVLSFMAFNLSVWSSWIPFTDMIQTISFSLLFICFFSNGVVRPLAVVLSTNWCCHPPIHEFSFKGSIVWLPINKNVKVHR